MKQNWSRLRTGVANVGRGHTDRAAYWESHRTGKLIDYYGWKGQDNGVGEWADERASSSPNTWLRDSYSAQQQQQQQQAQYTL